MDSRPLILLEEDLSTPSYLALLMEKIREVEFDQWDHSRCDIDDCLEDPRIFDRECVVTSLSGIIKWMEGGEAPRPNFDDNDAAIEIEAAARYANDMKDDDPAFGKMLDVLMQFNGRYWRMNHEEVAKVLRDSLAPISRPVAR